jgi:N-acetylglucosaminyl-diphospho-decaprenol L-rhamnosyltransferase
MQRVTPTVVIATRDRRERLLATLDRLEALDEKPPIVVVDDGSSDGTAEAVARRGVNVIRNDGGSARTRGIEAAATPLVAFTDDDSWWEPGALTLAAAHFAAHPRLALLAARIIVEPEGRLDPTCAQMRDSPLPGSAGPGVLGFVACGAVARKDAVLAAGGFDPRFGVGGEEEVLALDLAAAGWELAYAEDVVAHHEPDRRPRPQRSTRELRNRLWSAWLRRPLPRALKLTLTHARGIPAAARGLPWVLRERRPLPPHVERRLRLLED